jgi:excisionase family DNA binding protein
MKKAASGDYLSTSQDRPIWPRPATHTAQVIAWPPIPRGRFLRFADSARIFSCVFTHKNTVRAPSARVHFRFMVLRKGTAMDDILTTEGLARRLQVRRETVRRWARDGRIPVLRVSEKVVRYDYGEVIEALRARGRRKEPNHA